MDMQTMEEETDESIFANLNALNLFLADQMKSKEEKQSDAKK
jgi:hypothetical protein